MQSVLGRHLRLLERPDDMYTREQSSTGLGKSACGGGDSFQCLYQKFFLAPAQPVLLLRTLSFPILFVRNFRLG